MQEVVHELFCLCFRCTTQPLQTKKSPREVEEKHRIPYIDEIAVEVWLYYGSLENEVFQTLLK